MRKKIPQFSVVQADLSSLSQTRTPPWALKHSPSLSPAWRRRRRRKRRKSHTSSTVHLRTHPSRPYPRRSLPSFRSIAVLLHRLQAYPNPPREEHPGITEDAAAPVFAVTRASNLSLVYAKCPKRTRCFLMPLVRSGDVSDPRMPFSPHLRSIPPGKLDSSQKLFHPLFFLRRRMNVVCVISVVMLIIVRSVGHNPERPGCYPILLVASSCS